MVLELPWPQKRMFWAFEMIIFQFFANFWVMKPKTFSRTVRQSCQNYLNQNLVIVSFLEKVFEATLNSKTNVLSIWKGHFLVFSQTFEWRSWNCFLGKRSKLFRSKFDHKKLPRNWFWSNLDIKHECSVHLKRAFLSFLQIFEWQSWNHFLGKWGKAFKTI